MHRLFFAFCVLCLLLGQYKRFTEKNEKQRIAHAQAQLYKLEDQIQQSLQTISTFHSAEQFHEFLIHRGQQDLGFSFFYLENGKPIYWSDNEVSLSNPDSVPDRSLLHLPNGIYEAFVKQQGNSKIIGLLLLKKEYAYENKYLVNSFNAKLGLNKNALLSQNENQGYPIYSGTKQKLVSVTFSRERAEATSFSLQAWLYLFSYWFFLAGIFLFAFRRKISLQAILGIAALITIARLAMIAFQLPSVLYHTDFFSPRFYAFSFLFNSVGDFFLNSLSFFCVAVLVSQKKFNADGFFSNVMFKYLYLLVLLSLAVLIHRLIVGLILNSKINFDISNVLSLNTNSVVGLFSIMLLLWSYFFLVKLFPARAILNKRKIKNQAYVFFLVIISVYTSITIIHYSKNKERENRKLFAQRLGSRHDPLAEYLFRDIEKNVPKDSLVLYYFRHKRRVTENVNKTLQQFYFNGYWNKFNVTTWYYGAEDEPLGRIVFIPALQTFRTEIEEQGKETYSEKLFYLPNETGRLSYLSILPVFEPTDSTIKLGTIVIRLDDRVIQREEGFPELFVTRQLSSELKTNDANYSFARYNNDSLVYAYGNYSYPFSNKFSAGNEIRFVNFDGYEHLIYKPSPVALIVVSLPGKTFLNIISVFSYVLLFFSLFYYLTAGLYFLFIQRASATLKLRVRNSIVSLVVLSFVLIATGTVVYFIGKYDKEQDQNILARLNSLWLVLNDNFSFRNELSTQTNDDLTAQLNQYANTLNTDFNLYDEKGNLFYSSQDKIFDQGIISTLMNPEALFELAKNNRTQFVQPESAGKLHYIAAYAPFTNEKGKITGYLNLPYFEKQSELKKEISGFLSALINIYVFLLILSILLALFISSRITEPLLLIQKKLKAVRFHKLSTNGWQSDDVQSKSQYQLSTIEWKQEDEIGELVKEYNLMVSELEASAEKLARSERESAWREMAQQVAHEIKNPLTPMKLSVQHLQHAWLEKRGDIDELFTRISQTLIEQINALSNIATEFSNFAKMPKAKTEMLKLDAVLQSSVNLFENIPRIKIEFQHEEVETIIMADKEQLLRVFSNLIKNAIQSIENARSSSKLEAGFIIISSKRNGAFHVVEIADNGCGIPASIQSKIFTPYFTTKTSGMGLGLAMVKNIVETLGGTIHFESKEGKGTTFIVSLPALNA